MEEMRQTTIKVIYTRGGNNVLKAIHYVGMVGIATGVRYALLADGKAKSRPGLSASINFRARTNESTSIYTRVQQAWEAALGHRLDATCTVREILTSDFYNLDATIEKIGHTEAAPSYLLLCSPESRPPRERLPFRQSQSRRPFHPMCKP
jgi:hypothetical protein